MKLDDTLGGCHKFPVYEIDHLTALLHSRTVDHPVEDEEKRSEAKFSKPQIVVTHGEKFLIIQCKKMRRRAIGFWKLSQPYKELVYCTMLHSSHVFAKKCSQISRQISIIQYGSYTIFRVNPTTTIKGVTSTLDVYGGPSSSQSASEQNRFSGSKQGLLKRRSSVLDSDIGSVGPIRRIRQKPNLLSPKSLGTAVGGSPLSATGTGVRSDVAQLPLF
ncbi:Nuclear pore complex protein NUP1 [Vitis vinifera]|uniref:Nuclear pore complex protein NUP1 n=1 Tax=Vitis vinifera TaxID=29760 RepID=A0A438H2T1_VITVI|nr:Nuclear pore complex protein NUP1 [Vitis vinifera]